MPAPEIANESLPLWQQIAAGVGVFAGAAILGAYRFFKGLAPQKEEPSRQVVLEAASLADMKPVHDLNDGLNKLIDEVHAIGTLLRTQLENQARDAMLEEEVERRVEARLKQQRAQRRRAKPKPAKP